MVKSIYLQDGEEIFVDDEDYERVNQYAWHKSFSGNTRMIMNSKSDHLQSYLMKGSFQKLKNNDFTKLNLTTKGNKSIWQKARFNSSSKYKGVSWAKDRNKWFVKMNIDGKVKSLGHFTNEDDAGRAYNRAVINFRNGQGYLNVIGEDNRMNERDYKTHRDQLKRRKNKDNLRGIRYRGEKAYPRLFYKSNEISLGGYENVKQACLVYNKCAIFFHGEDAIINDVPITDELKEFIDNWEIPEKIKKLKGEHIGGNI
ncbi:AP2 domain-containing protein [Staphylococcus xylosus]|uniref:AP2 domain-containing protein n=1 Tax=Staphylococcus xylosus TaxID=1288 RepID=UPI001C1E0D9C|nr:AP2 domain-containing protein [Staphylococcus xylosus]MBU6132181.1 AP2 domain-containing protein [Staphylococcus xylosus]